MSNDLPLIGIIANPASGKDIRRLIAHAPSMDNTQKIGMIRRFFSGLAAICPARIAYMPDGFGIVQRAAADFPGPIVAEPLSMACVGNASDSEEAARRLTDLGAVLIVTLGGDGTNRVVVRGAGKTPLLPLSTGTNNVFPTFTEATLAGMAAAGLALGVANEAVRSVPRLDIRINEEWIDLALIDVVRTNRSWVGSRAVWNAADIDQIVLSRIPPLAVGMASLGWLLFGEHVGSRFGASVVCRGHGETPVLAPIAPGLLAPIHVDRATLLEPGAVVSLGHGPTTLAVDGEREIVVRDPASRIEILLNPDGAWVLDVSAALRAAAPLFDGNSPTL